MPRISRKVIIAGLTRWPWLQGQVSRQPPWFPVGASLAVRGRSVRRRGDRHVTNYRAFISVPITTDLGNMQPAADALVAAIGGSGDLSSAESGLSTVAAKLQADVTTAQSNLAPSCIPGFRADESAGLTDLDQSAIEANNAVSAVESDDLSTADDDVTAADQAMVSGGGKLSGATSDLKAWEGPS